MNLENLTLAERLFYSTVKLESFQGDQRIGSGTGFFFSFDVGEKSATVIITNKHVVNCADRIDTKCHLGDGRSGEFFVAQLPLNELTVVLHPDPTIDLCGLFFGSILSQLLTFNKNIFFCPLSMHQIPCDEDWEWFDAMEEVTMIGCPNGISDETNNLPIARQGITASHMAKEYCGRPEFLVDMACYPGSSGSPIFIYSRNGYIDKKSKSYIPDVQRVLLVGILYAGPIINNSGTVSLAQNTTFTIQSMMHLGNAIKSSQLVILGEEIYKRLGS